MATRRQVMAGAIATGLFFTTRAAAVGGRPTRPDTRSRWLLWYRQPAAKWVEALPVGTGRLGAMVSGGTTHETLQINEDTFWAGGPYNPVNPDALAALPKIRELIFDGKFTAAQDMVNAKVMARPLSQMPYQTLGKLTLDSAEEGPVSDYCRWLDLDDAEAVTSWIAGGRRFTRTVIASAADQVIMVRVRAARGPVNLTVSAQQDSATFADGMLMVEGRNNAKHGVAGALGYAMGIMPHGRHVRVMHEGTSMTVSGREVCLLIAAETGYHSWKEVDENQRQRLAARMDAVRQKSVATILRDHRASHRELFETFDIDLGSDPLPDADTSERIVKSQEPGREDPYLAALYLQYGRYLLAASSRPGTQPANLQGIWNDSNDPPWGSKYTININTQMNYWPAEVSGLAPCVEPLVKMVEELAESGRRTAQQQYGARGWVAHHNTDAWRASAPIDGAFWGMWPLGGAWLCRHLWDHYLYSGDRQVLERIYPVLRDAGLFFLDTLIPIPGGGGLVTSPSISPENAHHDGVSVCAGPACDRQILRDLFASIIDASRLLNRDTELRGSFIAARVALPADRVGAQGQLQEWLEDWDAGAPEINHRHVSHLYAVYPGHDIGPETPELYAAARRSLEIRGDDATGWGIGWRINLWARLGNGERAYAVLRRLFAPDRTYPNMFDAHPPFQIDGNFGGAAGILEMLVRDRPQEITLFPAYPAHAWPNGHVRGLRLRGGLSLDMRWRKGKLTEAQFTATQAVDRSWRLGDSVGRVTLGAGERWRLPLSV